MLKILFRGHILLVILMMNLMQKINQTKVRIEKVIKRNGDKLYVIWQDNDNSFKSWIGKKGIVK